MAANAAATNRSATDQLREQATVVGRDIQEMGRIAKDAAQETLEQTRQRADVWEKSFEDKIRQYPVRSLLIAAGVGLVIGALITPRR